jgi:hypothetical protein
VWRGDDRPSYDPRDLLKLYIYGYLNRIKSSRRLEDEAGRNLELLWLLKKLKLNGVEVSYNVQTAVDQKHNLIVDSEVINNAADQGQLSNIAKQAKEVLEVDEIKVLADKGYYSTNDLIECEKNHLETYVPKPRTTGNIANPDFQPDKFQYDEEQDVYRCPAGQILYPSRIREVNGVKYQDYKNYRSCKKCPVKDQCTKAKRGRSISRNLAQPLLDEIEQRTQENRKLYIERQRMVEHPFGTVKRIWGYNHFLTRGLVSVNAENKLHLLVYNLRRVINILFHSPLFDKCSLT